jgi:hypothetical protein
MEGFHPSVHDLGKARVFTDAPDVDVRFPQQTRGSAGAQNRETESAQAAREVGYAILVGHAEKGESSASLVVVSHAPGRLDRRICFRMSAHYSDSEEARPGA